MKILLFVGFWIVASLIATCLFSRVKRLDRRSPR